MLSLLSATNASERMDALEAFIEFWYGPRLPSYGEPEERLSRLVLPYPLRRFYAFAGRMPYPEEFYAEDFFYTGMGGHHLYDLDLLETQPDGRVLFFNEYQGDWKGLTLLGEDDPPVWIEGWLDINSDRRHEIRQASDQLSKFLVTHCLMTTIYEDANHELTSWDPRLATKFKRDLEHAVEIWNAEDINYPWYGGKVFLFREQILVHQSKGQFRFTGSRPEGVAWIQEQLQMP